MVIETNSPEETFRVGKELGEKAYAGQVFTLTGDLGVGKTVFTQGLAKGLGIEEPVNSPTFTIVQAEGCPSITLTCTGSATWKRWKRSALTTM